MNKASTSAVLLLLLALGISACESLSGLSDLSIGLNTGGGGSGGTGGEAGGIPCTQDLDCVAITTECSVGECEGGICVVTFLEEGTVVGEQVSGDCKVARCDSAGSIVSAPYDSDVFDDGDECTVDGCAGGQSQHTPKGDGAACGADHLCVTGACVPSSCMDSFAGGNETDLDCGGGCPPCDDSLSCKSDLDCKSGVCAALVCAVPNCTDYTRNGTETDVDCGGSSCTPCVNGARCQVSGDCQSNLCNGTACAACTGAGDCAGNESCSGGVCVPGNANGVSCSAGGECQSGICVDSFCCNNVCGGLCQACNVAGLLGTCSQIIAGNDPANECPSGTCLTGACDGAGACGFSTNATSCGSSPSCAAGVQTNQDFCTGNSSTCTDFGTTSCGNYACGAAACKTTCTVDTDCDMAIAGCDVVNSLCKLLAGQACTTGSTTQCLNGTCAASVCP